MMMGELAQLELAHRLSNDGLRLRVGPFVFRLQSPLASVREGLTTLYADYPIAHESSFVDFTVTIAPGAGWRRWVKPQVRFIHEGRPVFEAMPASHAFPLLEWSMNWCISTQAHHYLVLHAAALERDGKAAILPAPPGSGKSTLCAALIDAGWRLLSDELALISLNGDVTVRPLCRPVSLKNESIDIVARRIPDAVFNRISHETAKGSVTHMKVRRDHIDRMDENAKPRWIVFPRWQRGIPATLTSRSRAQSMLDLGINAFNYVVLGELGFERLGDVVSLSRCFDFRYSDLDDAVAAFEQLVQSDRE
jgi:HprK-related kinase A